VSGPCMCGDTECPSCGPLLGNLEAGPADTGEPPTSCDACGKHRPIDAIWWALCSECEAEIHMVMRTSK